MYALIADLVGSRTIKNRKGLSRTIGLALSDAASAHAAEWHAPLAIARGLDELSALMTRPDRAFDVAVALNLAIWPHRFRFSLASGTVDVGLETARAPAMDGSAFHRASDGLRRAKQFDLPFAVVAPELPAEVSRLVEELARLHGILMADWTRSRARTVAAFRGLGSQKRVAGELGVTQQSVSEALRRARNGEMLAAEEAIRTWLRTASVASGTRRAR
jgi:hypothetical protein